MSMLLPSPSCPSCGSVLSMRQLHDLLRSSLAQNTEESGPESLFEFHDPPIATEVQTARVMVAHEKKRLRVLNDTIARLQNVLTPLLSQQKLSRARIRKHTHLLAPIRRLPTELLRAIFLLTVPPRHELVQAAWDGFGTRDSPWTLTRVCSLWRNISLSLPTLWQTIVLPLAYFEDDDKESQGSDADSQISDQVYGPGPYPLLMLQAQLVRSEKAPLHIVIQDDDQPTGEILAALVGSSSRWETLQFADWCHRSCTFSSLFSGKVPLLRKLHITFFDGSSFNHPEIDAPSLRDVSLRPYRDYLLPPLPWTQITRFEFEGSWNKILSALPPMVNLLECHLYVDDSSPPSADKSVIVPTLRKLYLRGTAHTTIPDTLFLPCLEEIFFTRGPLPASLPLLRHSKCPVKRLRFPGVASMEALVRLFRQFPTITDLATNMKVGSDGSDSMKNLGNLFAALADVTLLPDLQRVAIHVAGVGGPLTCIAELANLIESRRTSVSLGGRRGILNKSHLEAFEKEMEIEVEADEDVWLESNGWTLSSQ
ncbi:hypothetical protein B0H16DRAFT_1537381 [Mycena metata]|uniref:F-box domain-containing protein n=1 Tax=Mycena metata TaxID=1033252 RepID=A0AAD7J5M8_9AGAR|nr:hypothetical protein B0H16DRAFT_1537381 [Mycena metata]